MSFRKALAISSFFLLVPLAFFAWVEPEMAASYAYWVIPTVFPGLMGVTICAVALLGTLAAAHQQWPDAEGWWRLTPAHERRLYSALYIVALSFGVMVVIWHTTTMDQPDPPVPFFPNDTIVFSPNF